jgi:hypothetical protein
MIHRLLIVLTMAALSGCSTYALQGRVVIGSRSTAMVVDADDPRLAGPPIIGAQLQFVLDPGSGNSRVLGTTQSDIDGSFRFPVDAPGAGFLEYEVMVIAREPKRSPAIATFALPPKDKRVMVTMVPGRDFNPGSADPIGDSMQDVDRWMR